MCFGLSLYCRYALDKGATALAVDIEDVKLHGLQDGTNESSFRILKHSVQRRAEAKFPQDGVSGKLSGILLFQSSLVSTLIFSKLSFI